MKIVFFGSDPWFSPPVVEAVLRAGHQIPVIVTKGDALGEGKRKKEEGRRNIKIIQAKESQDISLNSLMHAFSLRPSAFGLSKPDAIVLAAFGPPFLAAEVLQWPKYGCLNVHGSLLPRWRGASPVFASLREGDKETGVSIMRMTEEIDRGPVLGQKKIKIKQPILPSSRATPTLCRGSRETQRSDLNRSLRSLDPSASLGMTVDTRETLTKRLGLLGGELIVETLKKLETGQISEVKQPQKNPTPYTRRLTKDSVRIDWSQSPIEIERFIRAVTPWPGAWTEYKEKGKRKKVKGNSIKILKANLQFLYPSSFILLPSLVQLPGKNPVSWKQFLAGHPGTKFI